jgi:hypothetical protein
VRLSALTESRILRTASFLAFDIWFPPGRQFYGIWYASDDNVKTSRQIETSKTQAT